jgi:hypothetical protein
MTGALRRLTRNKPGKMTIIDYSLIGILTAYGSLQVVLILCNQVAAS